jgi:GLPGLI family protein
MKITILLSLILFASLAFTQVNEAYFKYNIEVTPVTKSEEAMGTARMLRNSEMSIYFDKNHSRVDFKLGDISRTTTVLNKKLDEGISYSSGSRGNIATKGKASDFSPNDNAKSVMRSAVKAHDEYRTILGFKCQKYTLNDGQFAATYWCTDEIKIDDELNSTFNSDLPSFPLAFYTVSNGLKMEYQASDYSFNIEDKQVLFSTDVPNGYTLMK